MRRLTCPGGRLSLATGSSTMRPPGWATRCAERAARDVVPARRAESRAPGAQEPAVAAGLGVSDGLAGDDGRQRALGQRAEGLAVRFRRRLADGSGPSAPDLHPHGMADDPGRPPAGDLTGSRAARRASPPNLRAGRDRRAARSASGPGTWPGIRRTIQ